MAVEREIGSEAELNLSNESGGIVELKNKDKEHKVLNVSDSVFPLEEIIPWIIIKFIRCTGNLNKICFS